MREETGAYLDPWHDRLKDAYLTTTAEMGIPVDKDADPAVFLEAMALHKTRRRPTRSPASASSRPAPPSSPC
ncbi:hypothetical protein ASD08_40175 [Streptomyces sp. Root369]|nr:hypothetical protein ASD08_40175 [Streptomyces sp. Root369]